MIIDELKTCTCVHVLLYDLRQSSIKFTIRIISNCLLFQKQIVLQRSTTNQQVKNYCYYGLVPSQASFI